jgi:succinyl-CoA synthetase beta subunit
LRFYEYESKQLLARHGVALPKGSKLAKSAAEARQIAAAIAGPTVLKSQVLSGGRMKAGGVLFADTPDEAATAAEKILRLEINGHQPRGVLVESRQPVAQEYYLGVTWDGIAKRPVMILSDMGGIDVEEVAEKHPDHIAKKHF